MMEFLSLPNDVILEIFQYLSIPSLQQIGSQTRRLSSIQKKALCLRKSVTIQAGLQTPGYIYDHSPYLALRLQREENNGVNRNRNKEGRMNHDWNSSIWYNKLNFINIQWLQNSFMPSVKELKISLNYYKYPNQSCPYLDPLNTIDRLLKKWESSLLSLTILLNFENRTFENSLNGLCMFQFQTYLMNILNTINSMPNLVNLTLSLDNQSWPTRNECIVLPIMKQLDEFYFKSANPSSTILRSLRYFGEPFNRPLKIGFFLNTSYILAIQELDYDYVATRFLHLDGYLYEHIFRRQVARMKNLEQIDLICNGNFVQENLNRALVQCPKLRYLRIDLFQCHNLTTPVNINLTVLPSITMLVVKLPLNRKICLHQLNIHTAYPSVEVFAFCRLISNCNHLDSSTNEAFPAEDCNVDQYLSILKPCKKLRRVLLCHDGLHKFLPYGKLQIESIIRN